MSIGIKSTMRWLAGSALAFTLLAGGPRDAAAGTTCVGDVWLDVGGVGNYTMIATLTNICAQPNGNLTFDLNVPGAPPVPVVATPLSSISWTFTIGAVTFSIQLVPPTNLALWGDSTGAGGFIVLNGC